VAFILAMLMFVGSSTSSAAIAITVSLLLLFGLLLGSFKALDAWYHRRNLRVLREMHPDRHAEIIRSFPHPGYRARLERDLARDLASYVPGVADAFGFADSLKREATIQYWLAASVVAALFVGTQRLALPVVWNAGFLLVEGVTGLAGLHFLMRWRRYLDTWLEVSRFGIADGMLLLGQWGGPGHYPRKKVSELWLHSTRGFHHTPKSNRATEKAPSRIW